MPIVTIPELSLHRFDVVGFDGAREVIAEHQETIEIFQKQIEAKRAELGGDARELTRPLPEDESALLNHLTAKVSAHNHEFSFESFIDYQFYNTALLSFRVDLLLRELDHLSEIAFAREIEAGQHE